MVFEVNAPANAGQIVVDALEREGVEKIFCTPGSHVMQFYAALRDAPSIRLITCKQEPNTSLMADAYARITGKPGVCMLTAGPGAANSIAGIGQAYEAASPVIHISGAIPVNAEKEAFHGVDDPAFVAKMFEGVTKWSVKVERIEDLSGVMAKAFHIAQSGRPGPVHVEVPRMTDQSPRMLQENPIPLPKYEPLPIEPSPVNEKKVEQIAEQLLAAKFPVICAGKGVIRKNATAELIEIAEQLSIPVFYPQDSMGIIPFENDLALGHFYWTKYWPLIEEFMPECDLLLSVGIRAGTAEMRDIARVASENHILIGFDDPGTESDSKADQTVMDPKLFLAVLKECVKNESRPTNGQLREKIASRKAEVIQHVNDQAGEFKNTAPIHPGYLMKTLAECVKPDIIMTSDVGNCQIFSRYYLPLHNELSYMQSGVWNAMSFGLPTAIVAKLEHPERDVIELSGDGAFMMTFGDFITAVELKANIVMVVLNDGAFGQMIPQQIKNYGSSYECEFLSQNFADFARSCGALGIRVEDPGEIKNAVQTALNAGTPAIVEVMTDKQYTLPAYK